MAITQHTKAYTITPGGQEMVSHGSASFPVAFYLIDLEKDPVPWHWHDEWEAVYVASGESTVVFDRKRVTLRAGQAFFISPDVLHAARGIAGTGCVFHSMVFHPSLVGGEMDSVFWSRYVQPLISSGVRGFLLTGEQPWHGEAVSAAERAWQLGVSDAPGFEFGVRDALSHLVFLLGSHLPRSAPPQTEKAHRDRDRIKHMLHYIQQHYMKETTLADIAASAVISESECLRCFRATIGVSPMQYMKRYRVQKAAELLRMTDHAIAEIGDLCGFQDTSYFIRTFREVKGVPPGEYRKENVS